MVRGRLERAFASVQPPPRLVDWSLFVCVSIEAATGLLSFTVGTPDRWYVFWLHRTVGLAIVALLAFKLARVRHRIVDRDRWDSATPLSVLTAVAALGTLATGIAWVVGVGSEGRIAYWTLLSVHVGFGLALVPLVVAHLATRFRLPRQTDFRERRTALKFAGLFVGGAVVYRLQETANAVLDTGGSDRRFTGSRPAEGEGNDGFPITSWVADDPDPIDPDAWSLAVSGLVESPLKLDAVEPDATRHALLDCTSGWYTVQKWQGVRVGDLLDEAGTLENASHVRFVSVTGYRWTLPIGEARNALLATRVGGEALSHGHGAPVRLVAPGRRGFQWVKWVVRVEVRDRTDSAQWLVTLISGFDS